MLELQFSLLLSCTCGPCLVSRTLSSVTLLLRQPCTVMDI